MPGRSWDTSVWVGDPRAIGERLGWTPTVALEEGFRRLAAWLAREPGRLAFYRERILGRDSLPRSG
jgi:hypothetical protein